MQKFTTLVVTGLSAVLLSACSQHTQYGPFTVIKKEQHLKNGDTGSKAISCSYRIRYQGKEIYPETITGKPKGNASAPYILHVTPVDSTGGILLVQLATDAEFPVYLCRGKQFHADFQFLYNNRNALPYQLVSNRYLVFEKEFNPEEGSFVSTIFDLADNRQQQFRLPVASLPCAVSPDHRHIAVVTGFSGDAPCALHNISLQDNSTTALLLPASLGAAFKHTAEAITGTTKRQQLFNTYFTWKKSGDGFILQPRQ